ncbi:hypothetical protein [Heliobacterium mobile]|nr:hypothetical protein [Heliobacterium mobile]
MEWICPACNGIARISVPCRRCSTLMEDRGRLEDFAQPYSPYDIDDELDGDMSREVLQQASSHDCVHLFVCPQCGSDRRLEIPRQFI